MLLNATARRGATGCITGVLGVGQDITELKRVTAETQLVAEDLTRTLLIDNLAAGQADSIRVEGGQAFYSLPAAPLGRWVPAYETHKGRAARSARAAVDRGRACRRLLRGRELFVKADEAGHGTWRRAHDGQSTSGNDYTPIERHYDVRWSYGTPRGRHVRRKAEGQRVKSQHWQRHRVCALREGNLMR